ncbi:MAG: glutamate--tRNA ligase [Gammaproteobacteria bacterium]|nr:glutamate--tRNA ligase [Gammaproteobacteria bacterium]
MSQHTIVTRFAPSPTGELHLGNARTALFNWLLARRHGGRFLLRIEDTDAERSKPAFTAQLMADLRWLGLSWNGEVIAQSARGGVYREALAKLESVGRVYPCYCSPLEIEVSRKSQLAAGRPPRYAGTCRDLDPAQRAARLAEGRKPALRFRVPDSGYVEFRDLVHGEQRFACADIGDFIVQRTDGSAAFFFSNVVDDALTAVTTVLRGEDHLSNTPRQLLIAKELGLVPPVYGHLSLITAADGSPLSKRTGAKSLRELRETGYLSVAVTNHLFRLGHSTGVNDFRDLDTLAQGFDPAHLVRSPARFDPVQLAMWQKQAVHALDPAPALAWMSAYLPTGLDQQSARDFVAAIQPNVVLPGEVAHWTSVVFGELPLPDADTAAKLATAAPVFVAAAEALRQHGTDWKALTTQVRERTGRKGPELFKPLRLALTGLDKGPEIAPLLALMGTARALQRLERLS